MKITQLSNKQQVEHYVAQILLEQVDKQPTSILGLATGGTMVSIYEALIRQSHQQQIDFSKVTTINLDEYVGLVPDDSQSYHYYMKHLLFDKLNITKYYLPQGHVGDLARQCDKYEALITSLGGVDIQLLGIGDNGHIGFNEPYTSFDSTTHVVNLSASTIKANSRFFENQLERVPSQAITMGIATILSAKKIILVAVGDNKATIIKQWLSLKQATAALPASCLFNHPDVEIVLDNKAASLL